LSNYHTENYTTNPKISTPQLAQIVGVLIGSVTGKTTEIIGAVDAACKALSIRRTLISYHLNSYKKLRRGENSGNENS